MTCSIWSDRKWMSMRVRADRKERPRIHKQNRIFGYSDDWFRLLMWTHTKMIYMFQNIYVCMYVRCCFSWLLFKRDKNDEITFWDWRSHFKNGSIFILRSVIVNVSERARALTGACVVVFFLCIYYYLDWLVLIFFWSIGVYFVWPHAIRL